ncbi:MAG: alpha/beta hydrolase family protein [Gemmataceae bacterium]
MSLQNIHFLLIFLTFSHCAIANAQRPTPQGKHLIRDYFAQETQEIEDRCLADIKTLADWKKQRPEYRRQFLEMLGLWPMPKKTKLKATVTGKIRTEKFTIEKLHFQSSPGLYVSGNLYIPKNLKRPAPAILYVCGHARTIINGVSYGQHVNYQHHPRWFAEHGYVCLIIDTLQLGEVQGIHHGTWPQHRLWYWHSLGYTPAGIECWNGIRALDYLCSRKEVDSKRIGVTGRSGGGATSWWIGAADDRVSCIIPVAGIADLRAHIVKGETSRFRNGVISGHCECMYMINTYRWDFAQVAALCAPRPLMLANSDSDSIFPVPGYRRLAAKALKIYKLYQSPEKFVLLETKGPHKDTPDLRLGAYKWMNTWLKDKNEHNSTVIEEVRPRFTAQELQSIPTQPEDARNATIHETFITTPIPRLPRNRRVALEWWKGKRVEWMKMLREKVFRGWETEPPALDLKQTSNAVVNDTKMSLKVYEYTSEKAVRLKFWLLMPEKTKQLKSITVRVIDDALWQEVKNAEGRQWRKLANDSRLESNDLHGIVFFPPRGIGPTRWAKPNTSEDQHIKRRFVLVGQTLDGQRVWDIRRMLQAIRQLPETRDASVRLQGTGETGILALYAMLFEPTVAGCRMTNPPFTHKLGPELLNVLRYLDIPQTTALALPRKVVIELKNAKQQSQWRWTQELQQRLGQKSLSFVVAN